MRRFEEPEQTGEGNCCGKPPHPTSLRSATFSRRREKGGFLRHTYPPLTYLPLS